MSDKNTKTGACLCGAVHFNATPVSSSIGSCHCGMCQKWTGGPLLAVDCGNTVSYEGAQNITVYNSSQWAERGFCNKCGSHLFFRIKETKQHMIPVGLMDNSENLVFDHQIFIDKKPAYYSFSNDTKNRTEQEVLKRYVEKSAG